MARIRWYGPTLLLLLTITLSLVFGPQMVRSIAWAQTDARIQVVRNDLANNQSLAELSESFTEVAEEVEAGVGELRRGDAEGVAAERLAQGPDVEDEADVEGLRQRRLRGGLSDGVDEILIDNGEFTFLVVPTRGMGVWKARHGDMSLGWQSPVRGPVHPAYVPLAEPSGLGFLDGFDELICRCGLESNGAPDFDPETGRLKYPLHGRIANRPAHRVDVTVDPETGEIQVIGVVEEMRFHFTKLRMISTISIGSVPKTSITRWKIRSTQPPK